MSSNIANQITSLEALELVRQGKRLLCPVCLAIIRTVPEKWEPGIPLHGIECSIEPKHFMIHCEDEHAMKEMRARMKARSTEK
jgi:hypothetical protein